MPITFSISAAKSWASTHSRHCRASAAPRSKSSAWRRCRGSACCRGVRRSSSATCAARWKGSGTTPLRVRRRRTVLPWPSHYVQYPHQPLHADVNYDGQLTPNNGLDARFEPPCSSGSPRLTVVRSPPRPITTCGTRPSRLARELPARRPLLQADREAAAGQRTYDDAYFDRFFESCAPAPRATVGRIDSGDRCRRDRRMGGGRPAAAAVQIAAGPQGHRSSGLEARP